jgi:hypothetical protein
MEKGMNLRTSLKKTLLNCQANLECAVRKMHTMIQLSTNAGKQ